MADSQRAKPNTALSLFGAQQPHKLDSPSHEQEETENPRGSTALPESEKYGLQMKVSLMVRGECSTVTWQKNSASVNPSSGAARLRTVGSLSA